MTNSQLEHSVATTADDSANTHDTPIVAPEDGGDGTDREFGAIWDKLPTPVIFIRDRILHANDVFRTLWRTSIQMRVFTSIVIASLVVVSLLGFGLTSIMQQQLLNSKTSAAREEIDRARTTVANKINSTGSDASLQVRLSSVRTALIDRSDDSSDVNSASLYDPVLIVRTERGVDVSAPEVNQIPESLRQSIHNGEVAYQYAAVENSAGKTYKSLIIGSPVNSDIPGLELYLVMPLNSEENTMSLLRTLLLSGSIVMVILLLGIVWVFSRQLIIPLSNAAQTARRFATGHFKERMAVKGEDEVATLAVSFNAMAESLSQQISQLEEFGSLQRQFTSDVSHELRTPLTSVRMAAELIHDNQEGLDPVQQRAANVMIDELDRFDTLLSELLEISRHDAGVADLSVDTVDIRGVVKSSYAQVKAVAEELGVPFKFTMPDETVMVEIDTRRVERILRNLMSNAIDHSEGKPVHVDVAVGKKTTAVTVRDFGVGLKPGQEQLVFTRFWRADPSRERKTGGTGLGLAIAAEDAQLHGGKLEAIGEPGVGSTFRLTLPITLGESVKSSPLPLDVVKYDDVLLNEAVKEYESGSNEEDVPDQVILLEESEEVEPPIPPGLSEVVSKVLEDLYEGLTEEEIRKIEQEAADMDAFEQISEALQEVNDTPHKHSAGHNSMEHNNTESHHEDN